VLEDGDDSVAPPERLRAAAALRPKPTQPPSGRLRRSDQQTDLQDPQNAVDRQGAIRLTSTPMTTGHRNVSTTDYRVVDKAGSEEDENADNEPQEGDENVKGKGMGGRDRNDTDDENAKGKGAEDLYEEDDENAQNTDGEGEDADDENAKGNDAEDVYEEDDENAQNTDGEGEDADDENAKGNDAEDVYKEDDENAQNMDGEDEEYVEGKDGQDTNDDNADDDDMNVIDHRRPPRIEVQVVADVKSTANTSRGRQLFVKRLRSPSSPRSASRHSKNSKRSISSTASRSHSLQGASRTTGGLLRGKAAGNVFNMADGM